MKTLKKKIGQRIKSLRKKRGFATQAAFAEALETDQATIGRWEAGIHAPGEDNLKRICDLLKTDEAYLIEGTEPGSSSGDDLLPQTLEDLWQIIKRQSLENQKLHRVVEAIPADILERIDALEDDDWASLRAMMGWPKVSARTKSSS